MRKLQENPVNQRQIELLKKRYEVDEERKLVFVELSYEKASDILLSDSLELKSPEIDPNIINRISDIVKRIPLGYKIDVKLKIEDYEEYAADKILEAFNDAIELNHYSSYNDRKKSALQIAFLLIGGIAFLMLMVTLSTHNWINEGSTKTIIVEIIDIVAWVFIWEAASILFLSPSEDRMQSIRYRTKLHEISLVDKEGKTLVHEDTEKLFSNWAEETKVHKVEKYALLIGGAGLICIGIAGSISAIGVISGIDWSTSEYSLPMTIVSVIISAFISIFGGFVALSAYTKKGRLQKYLTLFGILNSIVVIMQILFYIFVDVKTGGVSVRSVISTFFSIIFNIFYMVGFFSHLRLTRGKDRPE
jgi:hypothetical protein